MHTFIITEYKSRPMNYINLFNIKFRFGVQLTHKTIFCLMNMRVRKTLTITLLKLRKQMISELPFFSSMCTPTPTHAHTHMPTYIFTLAHSPLIILRMPSCLFFRPLNWLLLWCFCSDFFSKQQIFYHLSIFGYALPMINDNCALFHSIAHPQTHFFHSFSFMLKR